MNITIWNENTYQEYLKYLESLKDLKNKEFQQKLCFTKYEILGIKIPILRNIAKKIAKTNIIDFLKLCHSTYYEEVLIEGLVIASLKDETLFLKYFPKYINKIDNWAISDTFSNSLSLIEKNPSKYYKLVLKLTNSSKEFTCRVGLIILLNYFIKEEYLQDIFNILNNIKSDKYYINMAEAWLLCEIYIHFPAKTTNYLKDNQLNSFTQNKTISKIRDSYRVSKDEKNYLSTLKKK